MANLFALSALGASINVQGEWSPGPNSGVSLASWVHRASVGRDSYVRVVNLGYLFPFGHRAVRITVTDREFQVERARVAKCPSVAYLVTKEYIVVTEPVITYAGDRHEPFAGRGNPIRKVQVKTVTTPPIDFDPSADPGIKVGALGSDTDYVLWVRSGGADVPFSFVGDRPRGAQDRLHHQRDLARPDLHGPGERGRHHRRLRRGRGEPQLALLRRPAVRLRRHRRGQARGRPPNTWTPTR